ncbi:hypothetical protein Mterra_03928 [Calidithermus terrae]|uniref:Uncharacterized protein n=1 Tax=Calidithermus terrae TaxID=1408545 RepID=A0A399DUS9_9DEIN|nr:hypothetical protein [Calidithermus terrae]RIH75944.1 hypothetical protein Mterra_03928 [Calidithermus terrae]
MEDDRNPKLPPGNAPEPEAGLEAYWRFLLLEAPPLKLLEAWPEEGEGPGEGGEFDDPCLYLG